MVYEVLARKWRPQIFQDVVGQEHITQTLTNAVKEDRIAHAYLFGGARGVGKTSVARIFAKAMNCRSGEPGTPCNACPSCTEITGGSALDVQEIDGASNRGIEEIRDLRENIKYMPTVGRFRVYIIDEVHMLTLPAFNALLKTLEEPPSHVKFIFATTDPHKVPVTILSRCQRFDFKRIPPQSLMQQLEKISQQEGFEISRTGLAVIARKAEGSMRDAESLLDQVISFTGRSVRDADIADILGIMDRGIISEASLAVIGGNGATCLEIVERIYDYGYDTREFYRSLMDQFRNLLVSLIDPENPTLEMSGGDKQELRQQAETAGQERLQQYLNVLIAGEEDLRLTSHPRLVLETILIRLCRLGELLSFDEILRKLEGLEDRLVGAASSRDPNGPGGLSESPAAYGPDPGEPAKARPDNRNWEGFLEHLSSRSAPMGNVLRSWRLAGQKGNVLELAKGDSSFSAAFLDDPERKRKLEEYCREYFGRDMEVRVIRSEKGAGPSNAEKKDPKSAKEIPGPVRDVLELFNGEVQGGLPGKKS
jgi:DNA polymerase-3 subunit gamma/tau